MRIFNLPEPRFLSDSDFSPEPDAMQFSPDGQRLAIQAYGRVEVLDLTTGAVRRVCPGYAGKTGTAGVGFTADCRRVVHFNNENHQVQTFDLESGQDRVLRHPKKVPWRSYGDIEISTVHPTGVLVFVAVNPQDRMVEIVALDPASRPASRQGSGASTGRRANSCVHLFVRPSHGRGCLECRCPPGTILA
jgi:hypothetical protein